MPQNMKAFVFFFATFILADPQYELAFNAQVPDVAFVHYPYSFTLSASTFISNSGQINYNVSGAPNWLQFDSDNLTLYGIPGSSDVGSSQLQLLATDSTGSTVESITLVVQNSPLVQLRQNFSFPLQSLGRECGVQCISFSPKTPFGIQFPSNTFVSTNGESLYYYATLGDHVPLPAWMSFDSSNLSFFGITPSAGDMSETLIVDLIGSNVAGFSVVRVQFIFSISQHQFAFSQTIQPINIPAGRAVQISNLIDTLTLDGNPVEPEDIDSVNVDTPSWLQFDSETISFNGTPPTPYFTTNISVNVRDKYNDVAEMTIALNLGYTNLYNGHIGSLNATAGREFNYQLNSSDIAQNDLSIMVDLGAASKWLYFSQQTLSIQGAIPSNTAAQLIPATITFRNSNGTAWDAQNFDIQIVLESGGESNSGLSTSRRVGILVGCVLGGLFFLVSTLSIFIIYCRKKSEDEDKVRRRVSTFKRIISKPFPQRTADADIWAIGTYTDAEQGSENAYVIQADQRTHDTRRNAPPQVELNFEQLDVVKTDPSGIAFETGDFAHKLVSSHSLLIASKKRQNTIYEDGGLVNSGKLPQTAMIRYQKDAKRLKGDIYTEAGANDVQNVKDMTTTESLSSIYSVEEIKQPHIHVTSYNPFDGMLINRPLPGLGHGQLSPNSSWPRSNAIINHARPQSIDSLGNSMMYNDAEGNIHYFRLSLGSNMTSHHSNPPKTASTSHKEIRSLCNRTINMSRPVSRRGPHHSSFFAGGAFPLRKGSTVSRRFAEHGPGLTTINSSPLMDPRKRDSVEANVNGWSFNKSSAFDQAQQNLNLFKDSTYQQPMHSQCNQVWNRHDNKGNISWHTIGHTESSSIDEVLASRICLDEYENTSASNMTGFAGPGLFRNISQENQTNIAVLPAPEEKSIMDRTRGAYRRNASRGRAPVQLLGVNEKFKSGKDKMGKGKEKVHDKDRIPVKSKAQINMSADTDRTYTDGGAISGNEAFI